MWGEAHADMLESMANLEYAYLCLGRLEESKQLIGPPHILSQNLFGNEDAVTLNIMYRLLALYARQSDLGQAEVIAKQVVDACMRKFGEEHPRTLLSGEELVVIYVGLGQLEKAKETGEQVLEMRKRILGENHLSILQTARSFKQVYEMQKEHGKAEEFGRFIQKIKGSERSDIQRG